MKKVLIENMINLPYKLYIEDTPERGQRTVNIFGFNNFDFLSKTWTSTNQRLVMSVDEGGGAKSFVVLVSQKGNGYIRRQREGGELTVGRIFHIASPIYYVKQPFRNEPSNDLSTRITVESYNSTTGVTGVMLFPDGSDYIDIKMNNSSAIDYSIRYGRGVAQGGTDAFFESNGINFKSDLAGLTSVKVSNARTGAVSVLAVGGVCEIR